MLIELSENIGKFKRRQKYSLSDLGIRNKDILTGKQGYSKPNRGDYIRCRNRTMEENCYIERKKLEC